MEIKQKTRIFKYLLYILIISSMIYAQEVKSVDDWKQQLSEAISKRDVLRKDISNLESQIQMMKTKDASLAEDLLKGNANLDELQAKADLQSQEYRQMLSNLESTLAKYEKMEKHHLSVHIQKQLDSLQTILEEAKSHRATLVAENRDLLNKLQIELDALHGSFANSKHKMKNGEMFNEYVVGSWKNNRDCLWNIAKNINVYHDPYLWPKIWQANKEKISNPDLLTRGEKLEIPVKSSLTREEKSALQAYLQTHVHEHHFAHLHKESKTSG